MGVAGEALGVTWDGTGLGTDGTVWGGEFLVGSSARFRRAAALWRQAGDVRGEAAAINGLAFVTSDRLDDPAGAIPIAERYIDLCRQAADDECEARGYRNMGMNYGALGDRDRGIALDGLDVSGAADQGDVVILREAGAVDAADRAGAEDDDAHRPLILFRLDRWGGAGVAPPPDH